MIQIKDASDADLPWIRKVQYAAFEHYVSVIGRPPAPMALDLTHHVAALRVVPNCGYVHRKMEAGTWWLETIAVAPSAQGKGIGRALIADFEAMARGAGATQLKLYTHIKMTGNLTLYPALGYVPMGTFTVDGFERVYFSKPLSPT